MGCKSEDVGILESNSFNVANIDSLKGDLKSLVERRAVLGPLLSPVLPETIAFGARQGNAPVRRRWYRVP